MKKHIPLLLGLLLLVCLMCTVLASPAYADGSVSINEANFPDEAFREYVSMKFDSNGDGVLDMDEIARAEHVMLSYDHSWVENGSITQAEFEFVTTHFQNRVTSLDGIQYLTHLRYLSAINLTLLTGDLDLSHNTALETVNVKTSSPNSSLTGLTLGNLPRLTMLALNDHDALGNVDVSGCPALETLSAPNTALRELDVSKNPQLRELHINDNALSSLDLTRNPLLENLSCVNNPQMTALDVSHNPNLVCLWLARDFDLSELTLGYHPTLRILTAQNTALTELDISGCPILLNLLAHPEYYKDMGNRHLYETGTTNDDERLTYNKSTTLKTDSSVSINATNFPDETFRRYVSETWDTNSNNVLSADEIAAAESINLSENENWKNNIASLDGIQYFTNLRYLRADALPKLNCALDFSSNRELRSIKMSNIVFNNGEGQNVGGRLSSVTLGNLPKLRELNLTNQYVIKSIDVSQCPALENLSLGGTSISTLDVSNNKNLVFLGCNHTFLSELDVSNNTQLFGLNVFSIKVPFSLTLGNLPDMRALAAQYSHMDKLDISGCPILLGLLKDEYYTDQGDYHSYETAPGNDGSRVFYDKHVLLQTEENQVFTTLTLPAALSEIGEEAFAGTVADTVVLPESCASVGSRAFANCPKLQIVYAPADTVFAADAFAGSGHVYVSRTE